MAGSRTLKLSILGDVDNLNKSLKTASADVDSFGDKVGKVGKMVGAAFVAAAAAAGAYAVKIGVDGVKAALEDEKAQRILALTLENTTGATKAQIAAVETYITKTALATGVTDDQLRPALSRLVRSTKDTEEAQKLLGLAMDISSATGKPLEAIANSLGKAYDGNTNALGKLGLGIDQSILKTKDFNLVYESLRGSFAGFAANEANTFQGRLDRLNVAFDEAKETVGFALLPVLEKLIKFINDNALPVIDALASGFSLTSSDGFGKIINDVAGTIKAIVQPVFDAWVVVFGKLKKVIEDNKESFEAFWDVIKYAAPLIGKAIGAAVSVVGDIAEVVLTIISKVLGAIKPLLNTAIDGINLIIKGYNAVQWGKDVPYIPKIGGSSGSTATGALGGFQMSTGTTLSTGVTGAGGSTGGTSTSGVTGGGSTGLTTGGGSATGGVATVAKKASEAITNIAGAFDNFTSGTTSLAGIEAASNKAFAFGTSGVNTNTLAGIMAASGTTINVTVNGAMDKEGTARTIVDTLNNSYYRGTGGATNLQIA
jgi:phage-related protein